MTTLQQNYTLPDKPLFIWKSPSLNASVFTMLITNIKVRGVETPNGTLFHFHLAFGILRVEYGGQPYAPPLEPEVFVAALKEGSDAATLCRYLLDQFKVDQYIFTETGHGCRHWCATALSRLADAGFVDQNINDIFAVYETREVKKHRDKFPMPGTSYA